MFNLPSAAWLVYVGDSRTNKTGDVGMGPTGTWPYQFETGCPYVTAPVAAGNVYSYAEDGLRTTDILAQLAVPGQFNTNPGQPVLFFCWAGVNDLIDGATQRQPTPIYNLSGRRRAT